MLVTLLKAKLHNATVTGVAPDYEGSLTIDPDLMQVAGVLAYEKVLVANMANGNRFETYAIPGRRASGEICLNGPAAHMGKAGDRVVVMTFVALPPEAAADWNPKTIVLDAKNRPRAKRS